MKTIKECRINMLSVIGELDAAGLPLGEPERSETELGGFYHYTAAPEANAEVRITYREVGEGGTVDTEFTVSDGFATLKRSGAICSLMEFREGESRSSLYRIPPYSFDMTIRTRRLRVALDEKGGRVDILYNMSIGGAEKSARIRMIVSTD